jgi:hypothetical protein|tara:strand:- start:3039 stop:3269 length:231 start_codon:yes stop_codon:yes gene_type:complete
METSVLLVIFSILCFTFLVLGGIIGWLAQQNNYVNMQNQVAYTHPEMYDENGNLIPDEIVAVRFEHNDDSEEDDED